MDFFSVIKVIEWSTIRVGLQSKVLNRSGEPIRFVTLNIERPEFADPSVKQQKTTGCI